MLKAAKRCMILGGVEIHRYGLQNDLIKLVEATGIPIASTLLGNPIIFVLNNKGYTTECFISDGPYNDIHEWAYHLVPQILRKGWGCEVKTEGELEEALVTARSNTSSFSIINIHLDKLDHSKALARLGKRLSKQIGGKA